MMPVDRLVFEAASGGHSVLIGSVVISGVGATEIAKVTFKLACCAVGGLPLSQGQVALLVCDRHFLKV